MGQKHTEEAKAKIRAAVIARYAAVPQEERRAREAARVRDWHAKNPERVRANKRAWYERNRDAQREKTKGRSSTPERKAYMSSYRPQYRAENRDKFSAYAHARRARLMGAGGSHTPKEWAAKLAAYGYACAYCKSAHLRLTKDHVIPLARGGNDGIENIVPACGPCNSRKGIKPVDRFTA